MVNKNDDNINLIDDQEKEEKKDSDKEDGKLEEKSSGEFKVVDKND